ncbi:MAG: DUF669 domain-containing protein [Lachnospiraceae bacterium]
MEEREFSWDDTITKDASDYIMLSEGDYNFTVDSFERGRHPGSEKLPPCNKAILTLRIEAAEGTARITHNLFLHSKTEGMLSAFFACIGQKKKGEPLKMNWGAVPGSTGRCKVGIHTYTNKDGEERRSNDIKRFYPKEDGPAFKAGEF